MPADITPDRSATRDISVLQLLTRLVKETDRLVQLADDIDTHATTPQARTAFNVIGSEVNNILGIIKTSLEPLYNIYELDPGLKELLKSRRDSSISQPIDHTESGENYDESALWSNLK